MLLEPCSAWVELVAPLNGKVVVLATKGKEHNKFTTELRKYRDLQAKMRTPEKYVELWQERAGDSGRDISILRVDLHRHGMRKTAQNRELKRLSRRERSNSKNIKGMVSSEQRTRGNTRLASTLIFDANPAKQYQALDVSNRSILFAYQDTDEMKRKATAAAASSPLLFEEDEDQTLARDEIERFRQEVCRINVSIKKCIILNIGT